MGKQRDGRSEREREEKVGDEAEAANEERDRKEELFFRTIGLRLLLFCPTQNCRGTEHEGRALKGEPAGLERSRNVRRSMRQD